MYVFIGFHARRLNDHSVQSFVKMTLPFNFDYLKKKLYVRKFVFLKIKKYLSRQSKVQNKNEENSMWKILIDLINKINKF